MYGDLMKKGKLGYVQQANVDMTDNDRQCIVLELEEIIQGFGSLVGIWHFVDFIRGWWLCRLRRGKWDYSKNSLRVQF